MFFPSGKEGTKMEIKTSHGRATVSLVRDEDLVEFISTKADEEKLNIYPRPWYSIDAFWASSRKKGDGTLLLKEVLHRIPKDSLILANPSPLDDSITFEDLRSWWINRGFKKVDQAGTTLMLAPESRRTTYLYR
jgi:hypothetical protein